ncbi:tripartite tricarboxylate transporter substrate binding protein [Roseococcus sp. SYP-B2431]|uniref:Bug family tripartite tricarboxylate transporter substrate binding protein n=1 Tax=Roseococcus sp. SYP-B2431 TaxID=2496640 RepID=UPI0013F43E09|nr:tripartite tricarboxylate transporter substrate binding protein [Roseococcus sp. SYP-B2431]
MTSSLSRRGLLGGASLALLAPRARAQSFPDRTIRLVVPFTPGGTNDLVGRLIATRVGQTIGQPMVVDNRGGAGGEIGSVFVARAAPDGYTLLTGSTTTISINPLMNPQLSYNPERDFRPLSWVGYVPLVLCVRNSLPVRNLQELVVHMKATPTPLSFGSGGTGGPHFLAGERLRCSSGTEITHVPYRGGGAVHTDLVAGHLDGAFIELSVASPYIREGRMRAIGLAARERHTGFPDLPTLSEQGIPNFEITSWFGLYAPIATPDAIAKRLSDEIVGALRDPEVRSRLEAAGATVVGGDAAALAEHMVRERAKWSELLNLRC